MLRAIWNCFLPAQMTFFRSMITSTSIMANKAKDQTQTAAAAESIETILAAPLLAAVRANNLMAREQSSLILDTAFYEEQGVYKPVMINLSFTRRTLKPGGDTGSDGTVEIPMVVRVPLLTLLPMSALGVEKVDISYKLNIGPAHSEDGKDTDRTGRGAAQPTIVAISTARSGLFGKMSADVETNSREEQDKPTLDEAGDCNLMINIQAGALPLPAGLATLQRVLADSISPTLVAE